MILAAPAFAILLLASPSGWLDRKIVVFRHHSGLITDTKDQDAARERDKETIFAALKDAEIFYRYSGTTGRGYALSVRVGDLGTWQKLVATLRKNKSLGYYTDWQKDPKGYGLLLNR